MMPSEMASAYEKEKRKEKKYYFLKLSTSFFKDKAIKKLRRLPGGDTYALITLEIFLEALENDNRIYYDGIEDTFAKELALAIDESAEAVQVAVDFLLSCGWLIEEDPETYYTPKGAEMSGQMSARTERRHRAQADKLTAECPHDVRKLTDDDRNIRNRDRDRNRKEDKSSFEIDVDMSASADKKTGTDKPRGSDKPTRFVPPTLNEVQDFILKNGYSVDADRFMDFYEAKGWMIGKNKMKDWKAAVRNWQRGQKAKRPDEVGIVLRDNSIDKFEKDRKNLW